MTKLFIGITTNKFLLTLKVRIYYRYATDVKTVGVFLTSYPPVLMLLLFFFFKKYNNIIFFVIAIDTFLGNSHSG